MVPYLEDTGSQDIEVLLNPDHSGIVVTLPVCGLFCRWRCFRLEASLGAEGVKRLHHSNCEFGGRGKLPYDKLRR